MSIEHQQTRGAAWDIIDEAINAYDDWMLDDDYEPYIILRKIVGRLKERREFYFPPSALTQADGGGK